MDSFRIFRAAEAPYTYTLGEEGVEVLEFRHASKFNFVKLSGNQVFYDRAAATISANLEDWREAKPPSA